MSLETPNKDLSGRRVLVIEDESIVSMLIEDAILEMGCELAGCASRLEDALEKAGSMVFDIAILDVNLAGKETFPVAEVLMRRGIPFLFATGYGASRFPPSMKGVPILHKPFLNDALERALCAALNAKNGVG